MNFNERVQEIERTARKIGQGNAAKDARAFEAIKASAWVMITDVQTVYTFGASAIIRAAEASDKAGVLSGVGQIRATVEANRRYQAERLARRTANAREILALFDKR